MGKARRRKQYSPWQELRIAELTAALQGCHRKLQATNGKGGLMVTAQWWVKDDPKASIYIAMLPTQQPGKPAAEVCAARAACPEFQAARAAYMAAAEVMVAAARAVLAANAEAWGGNVWLKVEGLHKARKANLGTVPNITVRFYIVDPELLTAAVQKQQGGVDWRPAETTPEDYYAL